MWSLAALVIGFCIDLLVGDPHGFPHPVVLIGKCISVLERGLRCICPKTPSGERAAGAILWGAVVIVSTAVPALLLWLCGLVSPWLRLALESVMCWQILAVKSLRDESMKVYAALKKGVPEEYRRAVSMIVGRDTAALDDAGVTRAAVETVAEKLFGTIDRQYYCFVDYGGSFGKVEVIDGDNGYLSVSNERPMFNQFFGGSAQAGFKVGGVDAFLDLGAAYRKGYFGKKASGSVRFCDFDGMRYNLNARISFKTGNLLNRIDGSWNMMTSLNKENSYRVSTQPGQNPEIQYFGSQEVGDKTVGSINARYTIERQADGSAGIFIPSPWTVSVGFGRFFLDQTATSYPFYRKQRLAQNTVNAVAVKNFKMRSDFLSLTLGADYSFAGDNLKNEDGQYSSATGNPRSNETYLNRNFEYFDASSVGGEASVRYTLVRKTQKRRYSVFMDLTDSYRRLTSDPEYLTGNYRNTIIFTIGCNF